MSQLGSFKEIKTWNLDTDRKFLETIRQFTDTTYNGIKGALESLRDLEKRTEDCFIHLKHAVNWMNSLNYTKFIENNVQRAAEKEEAPETPVATPQSELSSEQVTEKYRKAISIAIADLNLKDIKADDNDGQIESGTMDGMTMAATGSYITAQLRGRIPFLIGSKEFDMSPYMGLEVSVSSNLTEDNLNDLKGEEESKGREPEGVENSQKAYEAMTAAVEEAKAAEPVKKFGTTSYLDSYSSNNSKPNSLFDIAGADDEDEVLPQYKDQQDEVPVPPDIDIPIPSPLDFSLPPEIDVPEPPPLLSNEESGLPLDGDKKEESSVSSSLFADQEPAEDFTIIQARTTEKSAPKADYKQRMNKLFGLEESDEEEEQPKETTQSLISLYQGKSTNLFSNPDSSKSQPKEPPAVSKTVILPPQNSEQKPVPKKALNFLVDDDDDDLAAGNTKKAESGNGLFSDD